MKSSASEPGLKGIIGRGHDLRLNGWRHFGQLEQRKSSVLFPIQSEKSPDSGFFTCDKEMYHALFP